MKSPRALAHSVSRKVVSKLGNLKNRLRSFVHRHSPDTHRYHPIPTTQEPFAGFQASPSVEPPPSPDRNLPFGIEVSSQYFSDIRNLLEDTPEIYKLHIFINMNTTFAEFGRMFQIEAMGQYFPLSERSQGEELSSDAVIVRAQMVLKKVTIGNGLEEFSVRHGDWESVLRRVRDGEKLTIAWFLVDSGADRV